LRELIITYPNTYHLHHINSTVASITVAENIPYHTSVSSGWVGCPTTHLFGRMALDDSVLHTTVIVSWGVSDRAGLLPYDLMSLTAVSIYHAYTDKLWR
jgi:hypothetical protein